VLCAGFPCQPFSKSGHQLGINETRGTLFFHIEKLLRRQKPAVVFLENVRNLVGPRHRDTWATIIRHLREAGYRVSSEPSILSPHVLPPGLGGTPQSRDRVFILGTYVGRERALAEVDVPPTIVRRPDFDWDPDNWSLYEDIELEDDPSVIERYRLNSVELRWLQVWEDFLQRFLRENPGGRLPGFPLWEESFVRTPHIPADTPSWKQDFLEKNSRFYNENQAMIDAWRKDYPDMRNFPASRRKFEWQAQDAQSFDECLIHFRPSGVRVKRATYVPALVAITQTTILGKHRRRLTPKEAAQLQGIDWHFDFGDQPDAQTYKQLGNGVAIGAAYHVFREHVSRDTDVPDHIRQAVIQRGERPEVPGVPRGDNQVSGSMAMAG